MAKKSGIRETADEAKTFGSAAISATGAVLKSFARVLDRGAGVAGEVTSATQKAAGNLVKKKRAAPKRTAKAAKKKPAAKKAAAKKKRASSRRKR
jgi:NAD/NADP transhydrogenase alpha subunit